MALVLMTLSSLSPSRSSHSKVTICRATAQDSDTVAEILTHSFYPAHTLWRWLHPVLKMGIADDLCHRFNLDEQDYVCWVALYSDDTGDAKESVIVGTVELTLHRSFSWCRGEITYPYISNLAIHPAYRRQGIGGKLLQSCETRARHWGYRQIYLHVLENNHPAQRLYQKYGYQLTQVESTLASFLLPLPKRCFLQKGLQLT